MPETDITPGGSTSTQQIVKFGDKLSLNREDDLALQIAIQLYGYTNFNEVKNLKQHAGLCIERANYFVEAYREYKSKNKIKGV